VDGYCVSVDLEWLNEVVLVALGEVGAGPRRFIDPLPANREPTPGQGRCASIGQGLVEFKVVLHDVIAVVPVEWIDEHHGVRLFDRTVDLCK